jgi:hypothetical protein
MIDRILRATLKAAVITTLIAVSPHLVPDRGVDPAAAWKASGMKEIQYEHRADCWTGEQPADVDVPTHVIARLPDGPWSYRGQAWTDRALNKVFDVTPNDPIIVLAFCR